MLKKINESVSKKRVEVGEMLVNFNKEENIISSPKTT
jgi:hypothetical protein